MDIKANSAVNYVKQEQTQVLKKKDTEKDVETTKKVQQNEDKVTLSSLGKQQANTQVESKSIEKLQEQKQKAALDNNQKLNDLKNQIKTGQFKVDSNVIANKILADKNSLHSLLNQ